MRAARDGVGRGDVLGDDEEIELAQRVARAVGVRQRHGRVRRHDPQRLDAPGRDRLEQRDRLEPLALGHPRRAPEAAHAIDLLGREAHMGREHVGEAADLAPAHGVRLAGERERPHARPADAARGEVAVDDRVDLVGALRRLVHALREAGDGALGRARTSRRKPERRAPEGRSPAPSPRSSARSRGLASSASAKPVVWRAMKARSSAAGLGEMHEETAEQRRVRARRDRQEEIGLVAGRGAARIDDDDLRAAPRARRRACGGTGPGGTRRRSSRRARRGRPRRGPRSSRAPCRPRRRAGARRPTTPCTAANWCRHWPSR